MTTPPHVPLDMTNPSTWCTTCGIHLATAMHPTCPVCDDEKKRAER